MDRKEYIKRHRTMWKEISEHMNDLEERKGEFEGVDASVYFWNLKMELIESFGDEPTEILNKCYLCAYASKKMALMNISEGVTCDYCPVEFARGPIDDDYLKGIVTNTCLGGLYARLLQKIGERDFEAASILADEIAHLPEKKEEEDV